MGGDSLIATAVLLLWIPFGIALFFAMKPDKAARITIFGGLLFLPELVNFSIPMVPPLGKQAIPFLTVLIGYTLRSPRRVWRLPRERWVLAVMLIMVLDGLGIALTNRDTLVVGVYQTKVLPGLTVKDGMFVAARTIFQMGIPFFLGSVVVREASDLEDLFRFLVKAGLIYSIFALFEMRASPQLHKWVYGYYQHEFGQTIRFGGYRPTVFMGHGLAVAFFFAVCVLASATLTRLPRRRIWGMTAKTTTYILAVVLVLCKSTGAIIYLVLITPLIWRAAWRTQWRVALVLGVVVFLYPSMREADVFPTTTIESLGGMVGSDREGSVTYRFMNEDMLLKKARKRPWFGWGEYNRNEVYDDGGKVISVTDGEWIIALGISGFVGFFATFGLLLLPVFKAGRRLRKISDKSDRLLVASTALIVAVTAAELLPNGLYTNYCYFLSGALLTVSAALTRVQRRQNEVIAQAPPQPAPQLAG
jgi:hypothetical protein